jgi:hypothetical protein
VSRGGEHLAAQQRPVEPAEVIDGRHEAFGAARIERRVRVEPVDVANVLVGAAGTSVLQ